MESIEDARQKTVFYCKNIFLTEKVRMIFERKK
jgi:hypothetical protein